MKSLFSISVRAILSAILIGTAFSAYMISVVRSHTPTEQLERVMSAEILLPLGILYFILGAGLALGIYFAVKLLTLIRGRPKNDEHEPPNHREH